MCADGCKYDGPWKASKKHGIGFFHTETGQVKKGEWKNGNHVRWI